MTFVAWWFLLGSVLYLMTTSAASPPGWEDPACTFVGSPRQVVAPSSGLARFLSCTSPVDWTEEAPPTSVATPLLVVLAELLTCTSPVDVVGRLRGTGEGLAGGAGGGAYDWPAGSTHPGLVVVWVTVRSV